MYTCKKERGAGEVKAGYGPEEKGTRKLDRTISRSIPFTQYVFIQYVNTLSRLYARHCARHGEVPR